MGTSSSAERDRRVAATCASVRAACVARTTMGTTSSVELVALVAATLAPPLVASVVITKDTCTLFPKGLLVQAKVCSAPIDAGTSSGVGRDRRVAGTCVLELAAYVARIAMGTTSYVGRGAGVAATSVVRSSVTHWP